MTAAAGRLLRSPPHALLAALCAGVALANVARGLPAGVAVAACGAAAGAALLSRPARVAALAAALLAAGLWWGGARLDALDRSVLVREVGHSDRAQVVVTGPARRGLYAVRAPARVRRFGDRRLDEAVLLELAPGRVPAQGAVLDLLARVRLPRPRDRGFDERAYLRRHGVHVVVAGRDWRAVGRRGGLGGVADRLRAWLSRGAAAGLRGERAGVVRGVVLGDESGLSDGLRDDFRASGLLHLLAVSGQNVAIIVAGVLWLARTAGIPRFLGELAALAGIGGYVLAVGAQPSVVRAGVAGALASLAWLASRPRDRWYFLLLGALVLLAWNPYTLLDAGFQLSFAAVAAIFTLYPRFDRRLEGYPLPEKLREALALSAACGLATAPVLWLQFHALPLLSVPANALAFVVAGPLLVLGLGAAVLLPLWPAAAEALAWLNGWCAAYLAGCARAIAAVPFARVSTGAGLAAAAAVLAAAFLFVRLPARRRVPIALVGLAVAGCVLVWRTWQRAPPLPPPRGLRISFLDVGQGDSALLQVPEGAVLVDEGPPEAQVDRQLRRLGVRSLAAIVLTHPQRDHIGGAAAVLRNERVAAVLDPAIPYRSHDETDALAAARDRRVPVVLARAGAVYRLGRLRLRVVWPAGPGTAADDPNDHAVVLLATYGSVDALLTADAESNVTLPLALPPVEILKVAHHGSADAGLPDLLARLRPEIAVVSVGAYNDYGHPTASTLAALAARRGLRVYRTDADGRVVVDTDGTRIAVRTER